MRIRTLLLLVIAGAIAAFAAINWTVLTMPTELSLGFGKVLAPIGAVLLGLTVLLAMAGLAVGAQWKTTMLLESHRHAKEMLALRRLADDAESSRIVALQHVVESELQQLRGARSSADTALLARVDALERALRTAVEQGNNMLVASIGQVEDRLERASSLAPRPRD